MQPQDAHKTLVRKEWDQMMNLFWYFENEAKSIVAAHPKIAFREQCNIQRNLDTFKTRQSKQSKQSKQNHTPQGLNILSQVAAYVSATLDKMDIEANSNRQAKMPTKHQKRDTAIHLDEFVEQGGEEIVETSDPSRKAIADRVKTRTRAKRKRVQIHASKSSRPRLTRQQLTHKLKKGDKIIFPGSYFNTVEAPFYTGVITRLRSNGGYAVLFPGTKANFPHKNTRKGETWYLTKDIEQFVK